eukprot:TRINITY_DN22718_c0_g1_i3.p1 TRINITY_DN22718_c0_g1~~TRINITY_DN22718_c0_g1_i3.p1  ORF type:complete len:118 (+),score=23.79 TRINITY_DN22718_c0_g1_i3:163-516(+)
MCIRDSNYFENNIRDIAFDNRGMTWENPSCQENCSADLGTSCFRLALEAVNYKNPPYSERFPEIVDIYENHPCVPVGNEIVGNLYCHALVAGEFINRDPGTVTSWHSVLSNNTERCL